jgi:Gpi18-like mannosyltransferase
MQKNKNIIFIILFTIITTLLVWAPFLTKARSFWGLTYPGDGMATIVKNFDGPNYIIVSKTWYDPKQIQANFLANSLPPKYYTAHFPLFPAGISVLSLFTNPMRALYLSTLFFSVTAAIAFYLLAKQTVNKDAAFWLTLSFLVFPARYVIVRSVGSPEPLFLTMLFLSLLFFLRKKYLFAGIFGALATLTRSPGILLFFGYLLYFLYDMYKNSILFKPQRWPFKALLSICLIPLSMLGLFIFYYFRTNDFLAYFHSGDNIHLIFPPFQVFNASKIWVGTHWLEDIIYVYLVSIIAVLFLFRKKLYPLAFFALVYFLALICVQHRDVSRYAIPMYPLAFIGLSELVSKKEFKWAIIIILPAIYLYAQNFLLHNVAPIADFTPYL